MCGIVGYTGNQEAAPILLKGLKKLEYRGYDSAGIAVLNGNVISSDYLVRQPNCLLSFTCSVVYHSSNLIVRNTTSLRKMCILIPYL